MLGERGKAVVLAAVWFSWGAGTKHFHVFTNFFYHRPVEICLIFKKSVSDSSFCDLIPYWASSAAPGKCISITMGRTGALMYFHLPCTFPPLADPWTYLQAWPQCFSPDFHASWSGCGMDLVEEAERLWLAVFSWTRGPDSSWGFTVTTNPFFMRPRKKKETLCHLVFYSHS